MSRRLTILERVSVKSPCHQDWKEMKGTDTVRFCSHCCKSVHNLSEMTSSEAIKLVEKSNGKICIRYVQTPSKSIVTKPDPPRPKIQFGRLGNLATGVFSLAAGMVVLANPSPVFGQQTEQTVEIQSNQVRTIHKPDPNGNSLFSGTVKDRSGALIPGAQIKVTDLSSQTLHETTSNEKGEFSIEITPNCTHEVEIPVDGFITWKGTMTAQAGVEIVLDPELVVVEGEMGVLLVRSPSEDLVNHSDERTESPEFTEEIQNFLNALGNENLSELKQLVRAGISVNTKLQYGDTPLMYAAGNVKAVKYLLAKGAKADQKNDFGVSALMFAVSHHNEAAVRLLLAAGANVNAQDNQGLSPLMFAAMDNSQELVTVLLSHGAKINLKDRGGKTALGYAMEHNAEPAIEVLKKSGGIE